MIVPGEHTGRAQHVDAESWLSARNRWTGHLVGAATVDDVTGVLGELVATVKAARAVALRPSWQEGVLRGFLSAGAAVDDVGEILVSTDLSTPGHATIANLVLEGVEPAPTLFVRMGPPSGGWVLALVFPDGVPLERRLGDVAEAVAGEAWAALRRIELLGALSEHVRDNRLAAENVVGLTHDLRTPLTGLLGFIRTLQHAGGSIDADSRAEYLDIMERQGERLAGLITDLLTEARIEAGELRPDLREAVDVGALVDEALLVFGKPGLERVTVVIEESISVPGDRAQLLRVVQNLVDNALKYAPAPVPVRVSAQVDGTEVELRIADEGPGIAAEQLPRLFRRFSRGEGGRPDSTGLGLSIVKGIVDAHGGSVAAESGAGQGVTFVVRLPAV